MRIRPVVLLAVPSAAAAQEPAVVTESFRVPTVGGAEFHVEVKRPDGVRAPVILTYSPYNVLGEPEPTADSYAERYIPKGYARAVADVIGTRNSSGCWDYGGAKEQQSGVDVVNWLAEQPWSNGKVAMIGGSYDGTTANMVAARGRDVPGLAAIVPIAAISRWYGYAYSHGIRYSGNSKEPTDEGLDTPLAFDFGFGRTPPRDPSAVGALADRVQPCGADEHTAKGYDTSPDYDAFWLERDYLNDASRFRVPALVVHGWQDYNVKQEEGVELFRALDRSPLTKLFMWQGPHGSPPEDDFLPLLDAFFDRTLLGRRTGVEKLPTVLTQGRDHDEDGTLRPESSWPPAGTRSLDLRLGRGEEGGVLGGGSAEPASYTDQLPGAEELAAEDLEGEHQWLAYQSEPLAADTRLAGSPRLLARIVADRDHGHLTPTLFDVDADGAAVPITRGFLNLRYRDGLAAEKPVPAGEPIDVAVTFKPQDWTVRKGHRLTLLVASSNTVWGVPDQPGLTVEVQPESRLRLPVVGAKKRARARRR